MLLFCANFYKASWLVSYAPLAIFFVSALSWDVARIRARRGASRGQIRRCQRLRFISTARVRVKSWVRSQTLSDSNHSIQIDPILISASAASGAVTRDIIRKLTMRTPRGGKALSRAASGRVPGPSTTNSSLNGIMLLIIFVTVLMVASFEHSLLREQRLADGRVVELPNVETVIDWL